jgi:hypothetical protein
MRRENDDYSDDGNTLLFSWTLIDWDWRKLNNENRNKSTQIVISASIIADGDNSKIDKRSSFIRNRPHNEYNISFTETDNLQNTDQTDSTASTNVRFSEQTLALIIVSALSLPNVSKNGLAIIDISKLIIVKVLNKRLSSFKVKYKCEFEPLWLTVNLAEKTQIKRVYIRNYENGLIRNRRLKILRVGKRKFLKI